MDPLTPNYQSFPYASATRRAPARTVCIPHMMRTIVDKRTDIVIVHEETWDGEAVITWSTRGFDITPTRSRRRALSHECHCDARDLVGGRVRVLSGEHPDLAVATRAVALAVTQYLRGRAARALDELVDLPAEPRGST